MLPLVFFSLRGKAIIHDKLPEFGVQLFNEVATALVLALLPSSPSRSAQVSSNLILLLNGCSSCKQFNFIV